MAKRIPISQRTPLMRDPADADITWADLLPEERQQVVAGMHNALAARIGNAIYVTSLNRQLEEGTCSATTTAATT